MKITLYGNPGTGTSTVGKLLASKLGYEFKSSGNMFRDMAKELGMTVYELDTVAQTDPQYDLTLDVLVAEYGRVNDNFVFESRLAWYFIPDSLKISLVCEEQEAARRVAERDGITVEDAKQKNDLRIRTYMNRYPKYYPELPYPPSDAQFDLIIDVTSIPPETILGNIITFIENRLSSPL